MIRTLGGAAAGIAVAVVLLMIVEAIGHAMFPPPRIDFNQPNAPAALPLANQLFPVAGWFIAALAGGWLAIQVSGRQWTSWLVAASILVGALIAYLHARHPAWLIMIGVLAPLAAAWMAQKLPGRRTPL